MKNRDSEKDSYFVRIEWLLVAGLSLFILLYSFIVPDI